MWGEHLHVETGRDVFIKLEKSTYHNLDRDESPCLANPSVDYSYTEVQTDVFNPQKSKLILCFFLLIMQCMEKCRWKYLGSR